MVERWGYLKRILPLILVIAIVIIIYLYSQVDKNFDTSTILVDSLNKRIEQKDIQIKLSNNKVDSLLIALEKRDRTIDKLKHEGKIVYIVRDRTADELKQFFTTYRRDSIYIQSR